MSRKMLLAASVFALAAAGCGEKAPASSGAASNAPAQGMATADGGVSSASTPGTPAPADPNAKPVDGEATLTVAPTAVAGADIAVAWTGPGNNADYVDIVPRDTPEVGKEIHYAYVRGTNGSVAVRAPTAAGDYDVRYIIDLGSERKAKVVVPVTVTDALATLQVPAAVTAGDELSIAWTGPNGSGDYVDLVKSGVTQTSGEILYAYTSAGNPAKLEAPGAAGDYDVRYLLEGPGGRKVIGVSKLKVAPAKATLTAPATVKKGDAFKVDWTGPRSDGDYVDLVKKGHTATSGEADYFYVNESPSGELTAQESGEFEIRYLLEAPGGRQVLVSRAVTVR